MGGLRGLAHVPGESGWGALLHGLCYPPGSPDCMRDSLTEVPAAEQPFSPEAELVVFTERLLGACLVLGAVFTVKTALCGKRF